MTVWMVSEYWKNAALNRMAANKARGDFEHFALDLCDQVLEHEYDQEYGIQGVLKKLAKHWQVRQSWLQDTIVFRKGDVALLQCPLADQTIFTGTLTRGWKSRGVHVVSLIHDLDALRYSKRNDLSWVQKCKFRVEDGSLLRHSDVLIVHNDAMGKKLIDSYGIPSDRVVPLGLFDYEVSGNRCAIARQDLPVIVAGNLQKRKAGYLYSGELGFPVNAYGVRYEEAEGNVCYKGSFEPEVLPGNLEGSYGLVWDGESVDTCAGAYGEYLRINDPHKTSLYLASGLPVIVWSQAAVAKHILDNGLGLAVASLRDVPSAMESVSAEEYSRMLLNVRQEADRLRSGYYTKRALKEALVIVKGERNVL